MKTPRDEHAAWLAAELDHYAQTHAQPGHRAMLALGWPLLGWGIVAMAWTLPVPPSIGRPGFWAVMALVGVFAAYWKRSRRIGTAIFVVLVVLCLLTHTLYQAILPGQLLQAGALVAILGVLALTLGRRMEHRRLRAAEIGTDLFIGPAWLLDRLLHRLGIR